MKYKLSITIFSFVIFFNVCSAQISTLAVKEKFAKGGDISWLPQMEAMDLNFMTKMAWSKIALKF